MQINHGSTRYDPAAVAVNRAGLISQVYLDALRLAAENATSPSNILFEMRLASVEKGDGKTVEVLDGAINIVTLDKAMNAERDARRQARRGTVLEG
jgi:hypothetical protein